MKEFEYPIFKTKEKFQKYWKYTAIYTVVFWLLMFMLLFAASGKLVDSAVFAIVVQTVWLAPAILMSIISAVTLVKHLSWKIKTGSNNVA
jgi:hypothetical protein